LPFLRAENGNLTPGEAMECQSARQALSRAAGMALKSGGAVAFSRTGDPALGVWRSRRTMARTGFSVLRSQF